MTKRRRIGMQAVLELGANEELVDTLVTGFRARRQKGEGVAYSVVYRLKDSDRQARCTFGRHGAPWTPETARNEARKILGEVAAGRDPAASQRAGR